MTTRLQTKRMLQSAAFSAALLLVAASAALAAPQRYSMAQIVPTPSASAEITLSPNSRSLTQSMDDLNATRWNEQNLGAR